MGVRRPSAVQPELSQPVRLHTERCAGGLPQTSYPQFVPRHARTCREHPDLPCRKAWMAGTKPGHDGGWVIGLINHSNSKIAKVLDLLAKPAIARSVMMSLPHAFPSTTATSAQPVRCLKVTCSARCSTAAKATCSRVRLTKANFVNLRYIHAGTNAPGRQMVEQWLAETESSGKSPFGSGTSRWRRTLCAIPILRSSFPKGWPANSTLRRNFACCPFRSTRRRLWRSRSTPIHASSATWASADSATRWSRCSRKYLRRHQERAFHLICFDLSAQTPLS
jgi:hypothetical protein